MKSGVVRVDEFDDDGDDVAVCYIMHRVVVDCALYIHASVSTINPSYVTAHHYLPLIIKMSNGAALVCKRTRAGGVASGVCVSVVRLVVVVSVWSVMLVMVCVELVVRRNPLGE